MDIMHWIYNTRNYILLLFSKFNLTQICQSKRSNSLDGKGRAKFICLYCHHLDGIGIHSEQSIRDWLFYLKKKKKTRLNALPYHFTSLFFFFTYDPKWENWKYLKQLRWPLRFILINVIKIRLNIYIRMYKYILRKISRIKLWEGY